MRKGGRKERAYLVLQALLLVHLALLGFVAELEGLQLVLDGGHLLLHL